MLIRSLCRTGFIALLAMLSQQALAFDLSASAQVGAWQEREETTRNHKGKVTGVSVVWMGVTQAETIQGVDHLWFEVRSQNFKVNRRGDRKPKGDVAIMKTLVEVSALQNLENPMNNLHKFAKDIVMQQGNSQPIRLTGGGMMAQGMLQAFGSNIDFSYEDTGIDDQIEVPAGTFSARKMLGRGTAEFSIVIRTMRIESETQTWVNADVPLAVVKQETQSSTNGKLSTISSELLRYGDTGAVSMLDHTQATSAFGMPQ